MPHTKSAKKRVRQNEKRRLYNKSVKSRIKTLIGRFQERIESGNLEEARELFKSVTSSLHSAVRKGVLHRNTASRKISRLARVLNERSAKAT